MNNHEICIIVPCYNEEASIAGVIDDLQNCLPGVGIVVINDASKDRTVEKVLEKSNVELVSLPSNLGIGGTVQTGLKYASRNGYRFAVKFDGDGQHQAKNIKELLKPVIANNADVTIGSRFLADDDGFKSTFCRRIGITIFKVLNSILIHHVITDNTSGFRAYNRSALEFLAAHYPSFDYPEPEEVVLLGKNQFKIMEVSTPMQERTGGVSSINTFKSVYYMLKVILAVLMVSIRPPIRRK